jgi:hypothetical protein
VISVKGAEVEQTAEIKMQNGKAEMNQQSAIS